MISKASYVTTTTFILGSSMLRHISSLNPRTPSIRHVCSLFSHLKIRPHCSSTAFSTDPIDPSTLFSNSISISQSILSQLPNFTQPHNFPKDASFNQLLFDISDIIPDVTRRFRRVSSLKPENVLELLLGFQSQCQRIGIDAKKVESLLGIFNLASDQDQGFKHLYQSCEVMVSLLIRYAMFRDVQLLLLAMEREGVLLDNEEILSKLIKGYVEGSDVERAVLMYDRIREQGFVPLMSCYSVFIDLLVRMRRTPIAFRVCLDMVQFGMKDKDMGGIEKVIKLLCEDEMVQQARFLMKQVRALGFEVSGLVVNEIAYAYCKKKDFEDSLNVFVEMRGIYGAPLIFWQRCRQEG
ncbi:Pentatricopeptide repeat (PPR) superfamily protein [Euphorbia peplus]|nr:Pentatricopeptide repeat (PPR) superfamily protein [Euphorbia peplus]